MKPATETKIMAPKTISGQMLLRFETFRSTPFVALRLRRILTGQAIEKRNRARLPSQGIFRQANIFLKCVVEFSDNQLHVSLRLDQ
jgi:hypothetical protein